MERPGFEADRFRILLRSWPDGGTRVLTQDWDRSVGSMTFSPDGRTLLVTAQNLGNLSLFSVDARSGRVRELIHSGTVRSPSFAGDRLVFGMDSFLSPVELYTAQLDGTGVRPITSVNAERLASIRLGSAGADDLPGGRRRSGLRLGGEAGGPGSRHVLSHGLHHPRRAPGFLRQQLPLPLEPGDLCRSRVRRRSWWISTGPPGTARPSRTPSPGIGAANPWRT